VVVRAKPGIITPSHRRENHGVHRTDTVKTPASIGHQQKHRLPERCYCSSRIEPVGADTAILHLESARLGAEGISEVEFDFP